MKIAIIGAGNVGQALASSIVRVGHSVVLSSSAVADARAATQATGAVAAPSNRAAVEDADLVILAIPQPSIDAVLSELGDSLGGKIVVDVTNHPTPDSSQPTAPPISTAEMIQAQLPRARVVKAFNTVFASRLMNPRVADLPLDGFVAGDGDAAKASVLELLGSLGFRPIDAGPLVFARTLEAMAWLNITLNMRNGWPWQAGWKIIGPETLAA